MTQEDKDLLLKDLCSRLPYKVICECSPINFRGTLGEISRVYEMGRLFDDSSDENAFIYDCKPYLFSLSSMTEEQKNDCPIGETNLNIINSNIGYGIIEMPWELSYLFVDWCNKNHFDYRGLIPKGLANDATGLNIY